MKAISLVLCALLLAGCSTGGRNGTAASTIYDFGMPPVRIAGDGQWSRLAIDVKAPHWLDSPAIDYRLNYEDPLKLHEYSGSRWAGAPAQLIGQRLRQQLGVNGALGNTAVDCLLRFELQEFSQVFDSAQGSRGVLHGSLGLFDARRQLLAGRRVAVERPASTPDARGGVGALVAASDELGIQIAAWLAELEQGGRLQACRVIVRQEREKK